MKSLLAVWLALIMVSGCFTQAVRAEEQEAPYEVPAAEPPSPELMLVDVFIVRPVGLAACAVGLLGSIVAMPFASLSENDGEVSRRLIAEPFAYTFTRPVGHFERK